MSTSILNLSRHDGGATPPPSDYVADRRQYRWIYALCFCVFLLVTLFGRLLPRDWRPFGALPGQRISVLEETRTAVATVLPFVFMA